MFNNKHGSAYIFIYGMYFFLFLGVLFIIFNQITKNELKTVMNGFNISAEDRAESERFEGLWNLMPYILVFLIILFFVVHIGMTGG